LLLFWDMNKTAADIREAFLSYFEKQGHQRVQSSSLIPHNDPTLLFTNAGMVQFKDCFLGVDKRSYVRAASSQKCVRAGGKHNDLENVGFTARHHTFFEMLGNFSFGDYFKKDAIHFAWEFTTKVLGLPKDRLRVSVFESDDESADIWHKQEGVPRDRIVRFGEKDNFWSMGETGPCGPCTEIFWDQGQEVDGDRWLEFWNCVFMQFDRSADGTLKNLPKPSVDTGMGLERISAILQGVPSNYDIDLMRSLIQSTNNYVNQHSKEKFEYRPAQSDWKNAALKVIVDHLRSTAFLIADGVQPSNEGRGYVLRRILRRAVRFGKRLGLSGPFLVHLFPELQKAMGGTFPELIQREGVIREVLRQEEEKFFETLDKGLHLLEDAFAKLGSGRVLGAETVFKLYDTFGFPVDLTALIAREKNLAIDEVGFNKLMQQQQEQSRKSWKGSGEAAISQNVKEWKTRGIAPKFTGYDVDREPEATVLAIEKVESGGAWVAIDPCPFYGEGGGQVGDQGFLEIPSKSGSQNLRVSVIDAQKPYEGGVALYIKDYDSNVLKVGAKVIAQVHKTYRLDVKANHSATHLLHSALRNILGTHVEQAGSLVTSEKLRFDFSHPRATGAENLTEIENWVNKQIDQNIPLRTQESTYDEAIQKGAIALFGEKYGDKVRVVEMPGASVELCGGTHVSHSGEIKLFKILSESAVSSGTRRIEAVTGRRAIEFLKDKDELVSRVSGFLKVSPDHLEDRVKKLSDSNKNLEKELVELKRKIAFGNATLSDHKTSCKYQGKDVQVHSVSDSEAGMLREKADGLRQREPQKVHILLSGELVLVTADTKTLADFHSGDFLKKLVSHFGGRGGGQAQTAQGQVPGKNLSITEVSEWVSKL
jgi:alanyl-tRNA synthetase